MSADPKSLATLAIATANAKKNKMTLSDSSNCDGRDSDPTEALEFRSTDEFIAGLSAALINTSVLFPINKLIFRQMASGQKAKTAASFMLEDGARYLYRGILPPLIQKMVSVSIMFGSFGRYKKWANNQFVSAPPVAKLALASILTGTTEAVLTPLERVQMLLQDRNYHKNYRNTIDALIKLKKFGTPEYYRGLTCVLVRNGPSNILFFGFREKITKHIPGYNASKTYNLNNRTNSSNHNKSKEQQQLFITLQSGSNYLSPQRIMLYDFLTGAILGMFISTLFYPLSVVRTRMQTRAPGTKFLSIVEAFKQVYVERDRKFTRLFRGCLINVMRQFISWGLINCSYEYVLDRLHRI